MKTEEHSPVIRVRIEKSLFMLSSSVGARPSSAAEDGRAPPRQAPPFLVKEGKQPRQFRFIWTRAVFANLEGFGVLDLVGLILAVPLGQFAAITLGDGLKTM